MHLRKVNYHIHTRYGDGEDKMTIEAIVRESERLGFDSIGITEHLSVREHLPRFPKILDAISSIDTELELYFGAEVIELGQDFDTALTAPLHICITEEDRVRLKLDFVIGASHSVWIDRGKFTTKKFVDIQHRFHCFFAQHPLVDVVGHPWSFPKKGFDAWGFPWFNDMSVIPEEYHLEFAQLAVENNTAVEVNSLAIFFNADYSDKVKEQYKEFIRLLADHGVKLSVGSDAHRLEGLKTALAAGEILEEIGIKASQLWSPDQGKFSLRREARDKK